MKSFRLVAAVTAALMFGPASAQTAPDAEALATLMAVNDHEIKTAELAIDKKVSGPVLDYAKMMDDEHSKNQEQTRQLSQSAGVSPMESDKVAALKSKTKAERDRLAKLEGAEFEAAYVDAMVKDHTEVLGKLDKELLPKAANPAVAAHLKTTREHVAMHLEKAKALDANPQASR
jgi:putative membrane protein